MPIKKRWLALVSLISLFAIIPLVVTAQDTTQPATPTSIPITGEETEDSAAPSLPGGQPTFATPLPGGAEVTEEALPGAAAGDQCPTLVQENFTLAEEFVCSGLQPGEVCVASGTVNATFAAEGAGSLSNPDDRAQFTDLNELILRSTGTPNNAWTVVTGRLQLNSTDGDVPVAVQLIAFGDVSVVDTGAVASGGAVTGTVNAQRGMVVRRTPENQGVVVWQLQAGEIITVTGATPDKQWIRMEIPSFYGGVGWVYAPYINVEGGIDALPAVTADSPAPDLAPPEFGPMQSLLLLTSPVPDDCGADIPDGGVLLQSPNGVPDAVRLEVNEVEIQFNGTIYLQAQANGSLTATILEGTATMLAGGGDANTGAGGRLTIALNENLEPTGTPQAATVNVDTLEVLPIRLLTRQFSLDAAAANAGTTTTSQSAEQPAGDDTDTVPAGFGTPPPAEPVEACMLTTPAEGEARNVRSGPGLAYPVINNLPNNTTITASGQATDDTNFVWYQISDGGWIRSDAVTASGDCEALQVVDVPPLPEITPTTTPAAEVTALSSSTLDEVACPDGQVTGSSTSTGEDTSIAIGGTWTANAGTSIVVNANGGQLRPEFGSYIQIVAEDGSVLAESGEERSLAYTFQQQRNFTLRFSAGNGDLVVMSVRCTA